MATIPASPPPRERGPTYAEIALVTSLRENIVARAHLGTINDASCFALLAVYTKSDFEVFGSPSDYLYARVRVGPDEEKKRLGPASTPACELDIAVYRPNSHISEVSVVDNALHANNFNDMDATAISAASLNDHPPAADPEEDIPALFATHVGANGLTTSLQAVAALIDDEEQQQQAAATAAPSEPIVACSTEDNHSSLSSSVGRKRSRTSMGEAQVALALASCGGCDMAYQRRRTASPEALPGGAHPAASNTT